MLVVFGVWFLDNKLHVDDPVGAVPVHMMNGIWGTIAVGLFATESAPGFAKAGIREGLFYGGGFYQLGKQLGGMAVTASWAVVTIILTFLFLKKTVGLRVSKEDEIKGLDITEHGLTSAYAGFAMLPEEFVDVDAAPIAVSGTVPAAEAIPVRREPKLQEEGEPKFTKIEIICKEERLYALKSAMTELGITGMTVSHVMGYGMQKGKQEYYRGAIVETNLLPKVQVDIVVSKVPVRSVIDAAKKTLYTGHIGDGKIFVYDVENVVKVRTGEEGYDALQDVE